MTPTQIRKARRLLGLSQDGLAAAVGLKGKDRARTVRRWEAGDFKPSGAVVMIIEQLLAPNRARRNGNGGGKNG